VQCVREDTPTTAPDPYADVKRTSPEQARADVAAGRPILLTSLIPQTQPVPRRYDSTGTGSTYKPHQPITTSPTQNRLRDLF
jgi:hypothetical protein